jgi:alkylation response protein AidB-like acyl-CoA dehydrogenase
VDFHYSEDQCAIREMAESIFGDHCTDAYQSQWDCCGESFDRTLWGKLCEAGLPALLLSEDHGGSALGLTDLSVVLQAQGRSLASVPLFEHALAAAFLEANGQLTPAIASGAEVLTLSFDRLMDARAPRLSISMSGSTALLSGAADAVPFGDAVDGLVVAADANGAPCLVYLRTLHAPGLTKHVGRSQHHQGIADLRFENVEVTVLKESSADVALDRGLAMLAALTLGVLEEQVRRAVSYTSERVQFGRPIGTFQAVQMRMADAQIDLEVLRTSLFQLLYRIDSGLPSTPQASATKFLACEASHRVGHGAQHVHGGIGVDQSYPIHRYLYWARAMAMRLGGAQAHLERLGDWLSEHDQLGWKYDMKENTRDA